MFLFLRWIASCGGKKITFLNKVSLTTHTDNQSKQIWYLKFSSLVLMLWCYKVEWQKATIITTGLVATAQNEANIRCQTCPGWLTMRNLDFWSKNCIKLISDLNDKEINHLDQFLYPHNERNLTFHNHGIKWFTKSKTILELCFGIHL